MNQPAVAAAVVAALVIGAADGGAFAREIEWSGYTWRVRTSGGLPQGPGPNVFSNSLQSVFVDDQQRLHLKVRQENGVWQSAEVNLTESLGYGSYEWEVSSRYDQYADNVVGGLFTYRNPASVAQQTGGVIGDGVADTPHEIDIELTNAWGDGNLHFTTHDPDVPSPTKNFFQSLNGANTTHRFTWEPGRITWHSFNGHVAGVAEPLFPIVEQRPGPSAGNAATYVYEGPVVPEDLDEIVIMNLWLFGEGGPANGPSDGQEQTLILNSFTFTPLEPEPGDLNGDGSIDARDLAYWQSRFGAPAAGKPVDANGDGVVNAADYTVWRDAMATTRGSTAASASVPESSSLGLVGLGLWISRPMRLVRCR